MHLTMMKTDLLNLLRRQPLTVNALCESLGVTRNAVNVQLRQLEAEGLVRRAHTPVRNGPGKPANLYEAAPGSEDVSSSAYQAVLTALLGELGARLPAAKLADILEQTGRQLARDAGLNPTAGFDEALRAALAAVERLGASTEVVEQPGGVLVRNYSCPVASAVRTEPCVCRALAVFFSEATGQPAVEQCLRGERLICQYLVQRPAKRARRAKSVP
jgi:predicted ArsR family transcriptional regulator